MCQFTRLLTEHFDLVEEHVSKNFEGQLRCQMQNPFHFSSNKNKGNCFSWSHEIMDHGILLFLWRFLIPM